MRGPSTEPASACTPLPPAAEIESLVRQHQEAIHNTLADPLARLQRRAAKGYAGCWSSRCSPLDPAGSRVRDRPRRRPPRDSTSKRCRCRDSTRHYCIEDVELQVAPSLALLGRAARIAAPARSLLLMGNPTPRSPSSRRFATPPPRCRASSRHFAGRRRRTYKGAQASPDELSHARRPSSSRSSISPLTRPRTAEPARLGRDPLGPRRRATSCTRATSPSAAARGTGDRVGLPQRRRARLFRRGARRVRVGVSPRRRAPRDRRALGRRRSIDGRSDGCDVRAARRRRIAAAARCAPPSSP